MEVREVDGQRIKVVHGERLKVLGTGSYAVVHLMKTSSPISRLMAVKSVPWSDRESIMNETTILKKFVDCPNIVQSFGTFVAENPDNQTEIICLGLEYASGGTLLDFIGSNYSITGIPEHELKCFVRMILQGLVHIHDKGFVHCDLKPANILLFPSSDGTSLPTLKIADFGLSQRFGFDAEDWDYGFRGSAPYMSPESLNGEIRGALDIWSLGCVMIQMMTGKLPWPDKELKLLREKLLRGETPEIPEKMSELGKSFLKNCFDKNPHTRWSAPKLLNHPYICTDEHERVNGDLPSTELSLSLDFGDEMEDEKQL